MHRMIWGVEPERTRGKVIGDMILNLMCFYTVSCVVTMFDISHIMNEYLLVSTGFMLWLPTLRAGKRLVNRFFFYNDFVGRN